MENRLPNPANNDRLMALKDRHRGRRAFLIGNGPSLRIEDLDRLKDEITFASNKIFLAFDSTTWRPTYYTAADIVVARNIGTKMRGLELTKVYNCSVHSFFADEPGVTFSNPMTTEGEAEWDPVKGIRAGHSVLNYDLKLAFWMGIREAVVIGCDFDFKIPAVQTGEVVAGNTVLVSDGEQNHFHPDYRLPGEQWTFPHLGRQREEFAHALGFYRRHGGAVVNASRRTKLDVWPRADFDGLF